MVKDLNKTGLSEYILLKTANHNDYEHLADFHYCQNKAGPLSHLYKLIDDHPQRRLSAPVVGIIAYGPPAANLAVRNRALGGIYNGLPRGTGLSILNQQCRCIRRVIIEPRYRGLGLATYLVGQTLHRVGTPMVEALSVMGQIHPFFERAGMKSFPTQPDSKTERMIAAFEAVGLMREKCHNNRLVHDHIETLPNGQKMFILSEIDAFTQKFGSKRRMQHCLKRTAFVLSKLTTQPLYHLWIRPDSTLQIPTPAIE